MRDPALRADLIDTLDRCMADDTNAWELREDGEWERRTPDRTSRATPSGS